MIWRRMVGVGSVKDGGQTSGERRVVGEWVVMSRRR